ncbi:MAG: DUF4236 domain-containing protein [Verrucomicrobia bacterium]|nr:DUF4236 domain-containing protein [Verrucomicrobiota bacterium]
MGLRFQKKIRILPGLYLNISKSGLSVSAGGHGATVNVGTSGRKTATIGVPGTGLSYRAPLTTGVVLLLVGAAVLCGIAYLIAPDKVMQLLHFWQPKWFPQG